jgi:hypothetical protein
MIALALHRRTRRPEAPSVAGSMAASEHLVNVQPLTIGSANPLLVSAPSLESAVNHLAVQSKAIPLSKGMRSALSALGKDDLRKERSKL